MPIRIQRKRIKGWRMPENAVYVGRPGKWGNPYPVGDKFSPELAMSLYKIWLEKYFDYEDFEELRGKDLACWCKVGDPCHADILLEIVNTLPNEPDK